MQYVQLMRKKVKKTSKLWKNQNSAHRRSQPKWQLVQTSYLKRVKLLLFLPYNKHLINRAKSVCMGESWPRSCVQTLTAFGLYLRPRVKILPYRPPARLRANYYMASSASGQDDPNRALWLATRAGKMEPSCPLGTTRCIPQEKFPWKPHNKSFIDQVCFGQDDWILASFFFCEFMDLDFVSVHKHAKKRTLPISSHLDLTLGQ